MTARSVWSRPCASFQSARESSWHSSTSTTRASARLADALDGASPHPIAIIERRLIDCTNCWIAVS